MSMVYVALSEGVLAQTMPPMTDMPGMPGIQHGSPSPTQPRTATLKAPADEMKGEMPGSMGANSIIKVDEPPIPMADPDKGIPMPGDTMADDAVYHQVLIEQLEYVKAPGAGGWAWDAQGWVGKDLNRLWVKTEGTRLYGKTEDARAEALWAHAFTTFWDWQLGVRRDFGGGPGRNWAAFGVQGLAPYWFDVEATGYVGPSGRTAARFRATYDIRFTQRLLLTPEFEANAYGRSDEARGIGSGISDVKLGLRLRYEIRREIAPYVGVVWGRKLGETADFARAAGGRVTDKQIVVGVRIWF
ncbi:copper resistance protein B [Cupriavidus basilensis]|uniref:copper resistance protein B n=1 Tax=Cupriavidus basilensis TaxID=68895 RepID=UPI0039F649AE